MPSLRQSKRIYSLFDLSFKGTNLNDKPAKCLIVPLGASLTEEVIELVKNFLKAEIPTGQNFSVVNRGKYLGIMVGPGANQCVWTEVKDKWRHRAFHLTHQ